MLTTLQSIQTGSIFGNVETIFDPGERAQRREKLLPNVRLANGEVKRETRQRLMLAFNTPFFPEVLVASSVMAEGVDLHLHCRHVIHHDLDWNPSVLEQRTGRLDRLGSKSEKTKRPIVVDEPFIEATQDERQFRVVKDRLRWFNVVMGERLQLDEWSTSRIAERVPLPKELAERMTMKLDLPGTR
ncbi:SWF/SNF helicase family protein [Acidobacteria bacterium AH-259-D05]|nr:SWF/SNF helicase family protein [Acidobacteria bacterium AH-259-D05]